LSALALPQTVRAPFTRLADATGANTVDVRVALRAVIDTAGPMLDAPCRAELERLFSELEP
jgi:hypothetical protein